MIRTGYHRNFDEYIKLSTNRIQKKKYQVNRFESLSVLIQSNPIKWQVIKAQKKNKQIVLFSSIINYVWYSFILVLIYRKSINWWTWDV